MNPDQSSDSGAPQLALSLSKGLKKMWEGAKRVHLDGQSLNADRRTLNPARPCRRAAAVVAVLCAFMVLFAATLRVAHSHSNEQDSGHCQICVAIHTAMPAASAPVHVILHAAPEPIVTPVPQAPAKVRVAILSDRAPPVLA